MTSATAEHEQIKASIAAAVQRLHPLLIDISHALHANPELLFQETKSAALLSDTLEAAGFAVERGVAGLDTAFVATSGSGSPAVARQWARASSSIANATSVNSGLAAYDLDSPCAFSNTAIVPPA